MRDPFRNAIPQADGYQHFGAKCARCCYCYGPIRQGASWCHGCDQAIVRAYDYEGSGAPIIAAHGGLWTEAGNGPEELGNAVGIRKPDAPPQYCPAREVAACEICGDQFERTVGHRKFTCSQKCSKVRNGRVQAHRVQVVREANPRLCPDCRCLLPPNKHLCAECRIARFRRRNGG